VAVRATISHSVPGRLRVRVEAASTAQRDDVLAAITAIGSRPGIDQVRADRRTGSALVTFDPDEMSIEDAVALLRSAHAALRALPSPALVSSIDAGISDAAAVIRRGVGTADSSVLRATRGAVDLRVLVPIGLAGLSARQLARYGIGLKTIPWYVLAYYAFDSFVKLHGGPATTTTDMAVEAAVGCAER